MASIYIFTNFFKTLLRRGQTEELGLRRQDRLNEEQAAWNANSCIFYLGHSSNKNICN